ncbi:hypothetical protein ABPG72_020537 [Tetrahymena utriculariae]
MILSCMQQNQSIYHKRWGQSYFCKQKLDAQISCAFCKLFQTQNPSCGQYKYCLNILGPTLAQISCLSSQYRLFSAAHQLQASSAVKIWHFWISQALYYSKRAYNFSIQRHMDYQT